MVLGIPQDWETLFWWGPVSSGARISKVSPSACAEQHSTQTPASSLSVTEIKSLSSSQGLEVRTESEKRLKKALKKKKTIKTHKEPSSGRMGKKIRKWHTGLLESLQYQAEATELPLAGRGVGVIEGVFEEDEANGIEAGGQEEREAAGRTP